MKHIGLILLLIWAYLIYAQESTDILRFGTYFSPKIETDTNSTAKLIGTNAHFLLPTKTNC
ncbi:MAG TPA: hypothetical protein DDX39_09310 [Bacteroidales bacterium]|nr:MAG: hypothetical protein A2W98_15215 [Bacteroidetes bacterium GWF2_33_38]OFY74805.1 MAG: hypothetical protein A2265_07575 [Bacteroidetes bacterium RIFOXYA12_FULL_33_9]OFY85905.1 MAG: hypothetical protein A2236_08685 [Bacteroidetes bacterium RIFOXYA2_FULL_33_7]HBF88827.1 hypothetical protein [Bacteroidales bacterium]